MPQDSTAIDIASCEREPIRTPGAAQPHGFLLALAGGAQPQVVQVSDNLAQFTGLMPEAALQRPLADIIGAAGAAVLAQLLVDGELRERPAYLTTLSVGDTAFDVLAHAWDGLQILEFEPARDDHGAELQRLYPLVGDFLNKINDADSIEALCALAAADIRALTGFGRVLVYSFDEDGHGNVLAESLADGYDSYVGQRFPASDIPRQARELYIANRVRIIQDANYTPSLLTPASNPLSGKASDLSFAALRSVSPVHLQYMRNMGTLASMSVSLVVKGKLWGLISCHHAEPRMLSFHQRTVCEQLGQILALHIKNRGDADELQFRLEVRRSMVRILGGLTQGADFIENLRSVLPELLHFARAGGVAIVIDDRLTTFGDTPSDEQIRALSDWLGANVHEEVFHSGHLSAQYPPALEFTDSASGLLAMQISRIHQHYLLWFRPEHVYHIDWAGRPDGKELRAGQLTPRTSFQLWRETIHGSSTPWREGEVELAVEFRTALLGIALERAEQMADLAEELGRANKELEAFSYSVSHDLRAPLRHIVGFSDLLMETAGTDSPERRQRFLANIKDAARLAGKLVDDLLSFSQMGRAALRPIRVRMDDLVQGCIDKLAPDLPQHRIDWQVGPLPEIIADPAFLQLALYNLLSNAVKFTAGSNPAVIRISSEQLPGETAFHIADNGVGFNMEYAHKLFGVFQRLHRMEDFQGTGIGLANVRRIIERHGGRVWATSVPGEGATFSFALPHHD
ncbi:MULTISPECIES: ATP-binding protein [unclassified Duganella]|uniref:ATP-binding protein n=1 Tax=unclassified Duganella TaxID=2636909 RepID=UPI00089141F1|nr:MULTISPECIES: ATP-binding protein [unclassified Duganella]SDF95715.1 Bacteriophytochrome (light-regulated signal transduction histidine kinase) [Duganella sp. OV458]SDJ09022.1 Bacteriophytochrome (light-regulated signal transduction histidine kinase) [Duganella sp. OV510]